MGTIGIGIAVAFLLFIAGIYDGYVGRLEALTLSLFPNVTILDQQALVPVDPASDLRVCEAVCSGVDLIQAEQAIHRDPAASPGLIAELSRSPSVRSAASVYWGEAEIRGAVGGMKPGLPSHVRVLGIDPSVRPLVPRLDLVIPPAVLARLSIGGALVSKELAGELFGASPASSFEVLGRSSESVPIVGVFSLGFRGVTNRLLVTNLGSARALVGSGGTSVLGLSLRDAYSAPEAAASIAPFLTTRGFRARSWSSLASQDFESLRVLRWIMLLVSGLSFLISGISIRNTLAITVLERRREIGVLRSMGVRDGTIRWVFLCLALGIGLAGMIVGIPVGTALSAAFGGWLEQRLSASNLMPISAVSFGLSVPAVCQVIALVVGTCLATASLAVRRALSLEPVKCLQTD